MNYCQRAGEYFPSENGCFGIGKRKEGNSFGNKRMHSFRERFFVMIMRFVCILWWFFGQSIAFLASEWRNFSRLNVCSSWLGLAATDAVMQLQAAAYRGERSFKAIERIPFIASIWISLHYLTNQPYVGPGNNSKVKRAQTHTVSDVTLLQRERKIYSFVIRNVWNQLTAILESIELNRIWWRKDARISWSSSTYLSILLEYHLFDIITFLIKIISSFCVSPALWEPLKSRDWNTFFISFWMKNEKTCHSNWNEINDRISSCFHSIPFHVILYHWLMRWCIYVACVFEQGCGTAAGVKYRVPQWHQQGLNGRYSSHPSVREERT